MPRPQSNTPSEIRKRIHKCNYTVAQLLQEMTDTNGTSHHICWNELISRIKTYRTELEGELTVSGNSLELETPSSDKAPVNEFDDSDLDEYTY